MTAGVRNLAEVLPGIINPVRGVGGFRRVGVVVPGVPRDDNDGVVVIRFPVIPRLGRFFVVAVDDDDDVVAVVVSCATVVLIEPKLIRLLLVATFWVVLALR